MNSSIEGIMVQMLLLFIKHNTIVTILFIYEVVICLAVKHIQSLCIDQLGVRFQYETRDQSTCEYIHCRTFSFAGLSCPVTGRIDASLYVLDDCPIVSPILTLL